MASNPTKTTDPIPGWTPQQDVCFAFDDKTGDDRSGEDLERFIADVRSAANKHGFDLSSRGTKPAFARFFHRFFNADGTYRS